MTNSNPQPTPDVVALVVIVTGLVVMAALVAVVLFLPLHFTYVGTVRA